jgi:hypothetical protein
LPPTGLSQSPDRKRQNADPCPSEGFGELQRGPSALRRGVGPNVGPNCISISNLLTHMEN